jgi:HK97 family phage portal protein
MKGMVPPGSVRGLSPIGELREFLGIGKATEQFAANFFGTGATLSGVVEAPGRLDENVAEMVRKQFTKKHGGVSKSHAIGVLSGGASFKPLSISPEDSQALEVMKFNAAQLSVVHGVPAHLSTVAEGVKGYVTGVMASRLDFNQFGLLPRYRRWERGLSPLLPPAVELKFNERGLLRGDAVEQAALMTAEIQNGVRSPARWRAILDEQPPREGEVFYMQGGTFALDENGTPIPPNPPQSAPTEVTL